MYGTARESFTGVGKLSEDVEAWREAGGTHVSMVSRPWPMVTTEGHIDYLTSAAKALDLKS